MTVELPTLADLEQTMRLLSDRELGLLVCSLHATAEGFRRDDKRRVADVFAALCVAGAEEQDRRTLVEQEIALDLDPDAHTAGSLLDDSPESRAALTELPDLDDLDQ